MPNSIASDVWSVRDPTGSDEGLGQVEHRFLDPLASPDLNLPPFSAA